MFQVSQLSWFLRQIASSLFGAPPAGTVEEAIEEFLVADELAKGQFIPTKFQMARAYVAKGDYKKVMQVVNEGLQLTPTNYDVSHMTELVLFHRSAQSEGGSTQS